MIEIGGKLYQILTDNVELRSTAAAGMYGYWLEQGVFCMKKQLIVFGVVLVLIMGTVYGASASQTKIAFIYMGDNGPFTEPALEFAEKILRNDGGLPPDCGDLLNPHLQSQIQTFVRTEMVIHSIGLMFLPHNMIDKART